MVRNLTKHAPSLLNLFMNDIEEEMVTELKNLGDVSDTKLTLESHFRLITADASKKI